MTMTDYDRLYFLIQVNMNKSPATLGVFYITLSAFFFATYGIWARFMGSAFGNFFQALTRSLIIISILVPLGILTKSFKPIDKQDRRWFLVVPLASSLSFAPIFYAYNHLDIGVATLFFFAAFTFGSYLIGRMFFKETMTVIKIAALLIALTGLSIMFRASIFANLSFASSMAMFAGLAVAGELVFSKKLSDKYSQLQILTAIDLGIIVVNGLLFIISGERFLRLSLSPPWIAQSFYSLATIAGTYFAIKGFKNLQPSIGGLISLSEAIFAVLFGLFIFAERPDISTIIGGGLIILAIVFSNIAPLVRKRAC